MHNSLHLPKGRYSAQRLPVGVVNVPNDVGTIKYTRRPSAPIYSLPPEILIHIFLNLTPDEATDSSFWSTSNRQLWILGSVCRRWREIVRSNPRWWSFIHWGVDKGCIWSEQGAERLHAQLSLSQNQPLHFRVVEDEHSLRDHGDALEKYREVLLANISRLSSLDVQAFYHRIPHLLSEEPTKLPILPALGHLRVTFSFGRGYIMYGTGLSLEHSHAPVLTRVNLVEYYGQDRISLPWSQLTTVSLECCESTLVLGILGQLNPDIVKELKLTLRFVMEGIEDIDSEVELIWSMLPEPITFSAMSSFTYGAIMADVPEEVTSDYTLLLPISNYFLSKLHFPNLNDLTMKLTEVGEKTPLSTDEFLTSFSSSLRQLHLEDVTLAGMPIERGFACIHHMLQYFPGLTHLTSHVGGNRNRGASNDIGDAIIGALESYPDLCPQLSSLELAPIATERQRLASFMASRLSPPVIASVKGGPSLRRLVLREAKFNDLDDHLDEVFSRLGIQDYRDRGTEVRIESR